MAETISALPTTALQHQQPMQPQCPPQKQVRVVRVVHYMQAPPGGVESLTPQQQQQLYSEARATIQQQQQQMRQPPLQQPGCNSVPPNNMAGNQLINHHNSGYNYCSNFGLPHATHTGWPANPNCQQQPLVGSLVMLAGEPEFGKCAIHLGEIGTIVEDDNSEVPYAVQGPRGDIDWYCARSIVLVGERHMTEERQFLGDQLFARIAADNPAIAAKVTGMLLDGLDEAELSCLLVDSTLLSQRVSEAVALLQPNYHHPSTPIKLEPPALTSPTLPPPSSPAIPNYINGVYSTHDSNNII